MYIIPPLEGMESLSSTSIRNSISGCLKVLQEHGYSGSDSVTELVKSASNSSRMLGEMRASSAGSFVQC
eukprot:NODE_6447_length_510_cov_24.633406_g5671_i0.p3 GENE.NODE_6447_length_510_cov_24.633406_g5671_i0~~NODE_6447_length_510_cov_24.633406_g5671_i0.p3  ORF type:complete len:69 (-),score=11.58 NODE_6447_length_510_cov_24.633406_g5671_i0:115-321(-)